MSRQQDVGAQLDSGPDSVIQPFRPDPSVELDVPNPLRAQSRKALDNTWINIAR